MNFIRVSAPPPSRELTSSGVVQKFTGRHWIHIKQSEHPRRLGMPTKGDERKTKTLSGRNSRSFPKLCAQSQEGRWRAWSVFASLWEPHKLLQQRGVPMGTRLGDGAGSLMGGGQQGTGAVQHWPRGWTPRALKSFMRTTATRMEGATSSAHVGVQGLTGQRGRCPKGVRIPCSWGGVLQGLRVP